MKKVTIGLNPSKNMEPEELNEEQKVPFAHSFFCFHSKTVKIKQITLLMDKKSFEVQFSYKRIKQHRVISLFCIYFCIALMFEWLY